MKPRSTTVVITPPAAEPVAVSELLTQLGISLPDDPTLAAATAAQMSSLLRAAREDCEDKDMHRVCMMQTQEMRLDGFPRGDWAYSEHSGWRYSGEIWVPSPPLMAIVSLSFTDQTGTVQTIPSDSSGGAAANLPAYTYHRSPGTKTMPGRISPGHLRHWPLVSNYEGVVRVRFRCGYNGPVTVSTTANSTALTASGFTFLADDVGRPISIPGAGAAEGTLSTTVAAVDAQGNATLAAAATIATTNITATLGFPVPETIRRAILIRAEGYYQNDYDMKRQDWVQRLLKPFFNGIS